MKQAVKFNFKSTSVDELERTLDKCLAWFYANPKTKLFGLNALSTLINSSKTATRHVVKRLIRIGLISKEVAGRAWILSVNQKHASFIHKKIPYHISKIYEAGVVDAVYKTVPSARNVILFGSYRWGTDIEDSDLDIAAETLDDKEITIIPLGVISELGYRKNVKVNLHVFSRNKIDLNLFANIANGIVLDGFLEVRP